MSDAVDVRLREQGYADLVITSRRELLCRVPRAVLRSWPDVCRDAKTLADLWNGNLNRDGEALGDDRQAVPFDSYAALWLGALLDALSFRTAEDVWVFSQYLLETVPQAHRAAWEAGPAVSALQRIIALRRSWNPNACPASCTCPCHRKET